MPKKLGIIATDGEMKKAIEKLYPYETQTGKFIIEILDQEQIDEQGKYLEAKGASVIIGRSGTYDRNIENVSVPLLRLRVTAADIFNALIKASKIKGKIKVIIWEGVFFDRLWLEMISGEVEIYTFKNGEDIENVYIEAISTDSDCVVVGGGVICSLARGDGISSVFINASDESITEIINHAEEVLGYLNNAQYQHELLSKMLNNVQDAVIVIDENDKVQLFNERAQNILKVGSARIMNKKLSNILPDFSFLKDNLINEIEEKEKLIRIRSLVLNYSTSLIWKDNKIKGMLLIFQDTTRLQRLEQKIRRELNKKGLVARYNFKDIIYADESMDIVIKRAKMIGKRDSSVVIYGESGTGKELMAQSIHNISDRNQAPFVAINCAALSESLLESELFGYEEGAFTGARKGGKPGLFELAHGGTIFLDEINSISLGLQSKLLRVVEEKEVMRLGSDYLIPLNVRIICAANEDLKAMLQKKTFRGDLFYRLSSFEIIIPPLRERQSDIEPLFIFFLKTFQLDEKIKWPGEKDIEKLMSHDWLGNVRELKNVAERYILFNEINLLKSKDNQSDKIYNDTIDLKEIHNLIDDRIIAQLMKSGLSKNEIAKKLGISRATLWNKNKKNV